MVVIGTHKFTAKLFTKDLLKNDFHFLYSKTYFHVFFIIILYDK